MFSIINVLINLCTSRMQDLRPGNGPKPKMGETVVVMHIIVSTFSLFNSFVTVDWLEIRSLI